MTYQELALVEQVTYIDKNVFEVAGITEKYGDTVFKLQNGKTLGEQLEIFGPEEIQKLRDYGDKNIDGGVISGKEWASIIETIKGNEELSSLVIANHETLTTSVGDTVNLQICYSVPNSNKGIITYKGTSGYDEWYDNFKGIISQDTDCQKDALRFYKENANAYDDITLVGHSKGANKAMYVTVAADDDRIKKCVALDGQGFSNKFLEHYDPQIKKHGGKITNYFIDKDFVHGLMKPIPNANLQPCEGFGMTNGAQYHSPNSFFKAEDGKIVLGENKKPEFNLLDQEDKNIKHINGFTSYIMDHCSEDELKGIVNYLGPVVGHALGEKKVFKTIGAMTSDVKQLGKIRNLVGDYAKENNLTKKDFDNFLQTFATDKKSAFVMGAIGFVIHVVDNVGKAIKSAAQHIKEFFEKVKMKFNPAEFEKEIGYLDNRAKDVQEKMASLKNTTKNKVKIKNDQTLVRAHELSRKNNRAL